MQEVKPSLTIVYTQPQPGVFRHSLFSCCNSCSDCMTAFCCPHFYSYCASQDAGEGTLMSCIQCFTFPFCVCCLRNSARGKKSIDGNCCLDFFIASCCPFCSIIQIRREFKS